MPIGKAADFILPPSSFILGYHVTTTLRTGLAGASPPSL